MHNAENAAGPPAQPRPYHHRNRRVIIPDGVMAVGLIVGAHGLHGEVKIEPHTDYAERFAKGSTLLLGANLIQMTVIASRPHKSLHLVLFEGIGNRTDAESLRGNWLFIPEENAAPLGEDEYWIHDLVGMEVQDTQGRVLGTVEDVMATGANDVYIIEPAEDINDGREILLPAIAEVIQDVDADQRIIVVNLIPGLIDEDSTSG